MSTATPLDTTSVSLFDLLKRRLETAYKRLPKGFDESLQESIGNLLAVATDPFKHVGLWIPSHTLERSYRESLSSKGYGGKQVALVFEGTSTEPLTMEGNKPIEVFRELQLGGSVPEKAIHPNGETLDSPWYFEFMQK